MTLDIMAATSIRAVVSEVQTSIGDAVMLSAEAVEAGWSLKQALLFATLAGIIGYAAGKAMGLVADFADELLTRSSARIRRGFAKIGGVLFQPGTILTRSRLIPGVPGQVIGGNSQTLKRNILKAHGLRTAFKTAGYQTHHLIPRQHRGHRVLRKIGMDLDDATNGIFLHEQTMHLRAHSAYSSAVEMALDNIAENLSVQDTMAEVYSIQARATEKLLEGNSLRRELSTSVEQWHTWLSKSMFR
jgi:hypothetical protein